VIRAGRTLRDVGSATWESGIPFIGLVFIVLSLPNVRRCGAWCGLWSAQ
jgi:hypothetical protein